MKNCWNNIMKFGIKSSVSLKNCSIVNLLTIKKHLRTKINSYEEKIGTRFHGVKIPKQDSQCVCLSVILIYSVFRIGKNRYPQMLLEKCRCVFKEKKMPADDIETYFDKEDSNEESSDESEAKQFR